MGLRSRLKNTVRGLLGAPDHSNRTPSTAPVPAPVPTPAPVQRVQAPVVVAPPIVAPVVAPVVAPEIEPEAVVEAAPVVEVAAEPEPEPDVAPEPIADEIAAQQADPSPPRSAESAPKATDAPVRNAHYRPQFEGEQGGYTVRVYNEAEGLDITFNCQPGEFVLEGADRAGYELPYSCRSGGCLTCSGLRLQGATELGEQYVLEEEHLARGFVLLCICSVTADSVFISHQQDEIG